MLGRPKMVGLLVGGVLMVGGAIFAFTYDPDTDPGEAPPPVRPAKTEVVESVSAAVKRAFPGVVRAQDEVDLSFRVSGPLVALPVKAGDEVKKNDVLAQIDQRDYRTALLKITAQLEQARAQLAKMKAGERAEDIRILENQVSAAKAAWELAQKEVERNQPLADKGRISKSAFDQIKLKADLAKDEFDAATDALQRGKAGARQEDLDAQEALIRGLVTQQTEAQNALDDTTLTAPFDGVIAKRYVDNYKDVRAKSPIVSLQSITRVKVVADIPESLAARAKKSDVERVTVQFEIPNSPEFDAEMDEFQLEADPKTQTYAATVSLPRPEQYNIMPGMSASLRVYLDKNFGDRGEGVAVPADALFVDEGGTPYVWVVAESADAAGHYGVERRAVETRNMGGGQIVVSSGVESGERVVTAGVHFLTKSTKIRLLEEK